MFVFFLPPPKSVPNKKCFQTGMPSFHSNPILFYIPGWTLLKTKIYTDAWMDLLLNTEIYHPAAIWAHHTSTTPGRHPSEEKDQLEQDLGHVSLWLLRKAASNPEDVSSHSRLLERLRNFTPLGHIILIIILAYSSRAQRLAGILNRELRRK